MLKDPKKFLPVYSANNNNKLRNYSLIKHFFRKELPKANETFSQLSYCSLNMSQCDVTEKSEKFIVNVYNSIASFTNKYVRVPVTNRTYQVMDPAGFIFDFLYINPDIQKI